MKKLTIILLTFFLLVSCGKSDDILVEKNTETPQTNIETEKQPEEIVVEEINNKDIDTNTGEELTNIDLLNIEDDTISFNEIVNNINNIKEEYKNNNEFLSCLNNNYDNCYAMAVAQNSIQKNDKNICNDLITEFAKNECIKTFTVQRAVKNLEMSECENIKDDKFYEVNCKYEVAIALIEENNSLDYCNEIYKEDLTKKTTSEENDINLDENLYSEEMFQETVKMCINTGAYSLAMKTKEIKYCLKLQDKEQINMCKDDIKNILEMEKYEEVETPIIPE